MSAQLPPTKKRKSRKPSAEAPVDAEAEAAARAAKKALREKLRVQRMPVEKREQYYRQQAALRKAEFERDRAKAEASKAPSMLELAELYAAAPLPYEPHDDADTRAVHDAQAAADEPDDDDDDDDDDAADADSRTKRKRTGGDDDGDDSDGAVPSYFDKAAFARFKQSKAAEVEREIGKLRAALKPDRFYDAQLAYIEKRKRQLEQRLRADFIREQRDKRMDQKQKSRWAHNKRTQRGQPIMRTMIHDVLHKLEHSDLAATNAPHLYKQKAPAPVAPVVSHHRQRRQEQQRQQAPQFRAPRTGSKAAVNQ